jgi:hypothetical protein
MTHHHVHEVEIVGLTLTIVLTCIRLIYAIKGSSKKIDSQTIYNLKRRRALGFFAVSLILSFVGFGFIYVGILEKWEIYKLLIGTAILVFESYQIRRLYKFCVENEINLWEDPYQSSGK